MILRALARVVALLPWRWLGPLGALLGFVAGSVLRVRRRHVLESMRAAGVAGPEREASRMYAELGRGALEVLWVAGRRAARLDELVTLAPEAEQALRAAEARGEGVVIAASHTSNWELAAFAMASSGPLQVVVKRQGVAAFDAFCTQLRARFGVDLSAPDGALSRARAALRDHGRVVMMLDQVPGERRHGVPVEFLGRVALADRAPAALAAQTGAPLLVAAARRRPDGKLRLELLERLTPPPRPGPAWVEEATVAATRALDRFVREEPASWLWLHRRWKVPGEDLRP
jgi:KDO2-lipid IV(A) lauroyltransferase